MRWRGWPCGVVLVLACAADARAAVITPRIVSSFQTPAGAIKGLTWGDGSLWLADENQKIYRLDASGQVQSSFSHTIDVSDLAWFEDSLWVHDGGKVYKLNASGQIIETLNVGYWSLSGMEWADGFLYVGDYNFSNIHKHDRAGNHILSWPTGSAIFGHPTDMVYDGSSLWMLDSCEGSSNAIWQFSLLGQAKDSVDLRDIETCSWGSSRGLAWDGRYFWYASRFVVYQLDTGGDDVPPTASVVSPSGGEYWLLSEAGSPANTQVITWVMSDNVRVCKVDVSLWYSNDGGASYAQSPAGGGLPASFGPGGACTGLGEGKTSLTYSVPTTFPSGTSGSLYKVQVEVTDHAGNKLIVDPQSGLNAVRSGNPFYIVRPNPESVRTLILKDTARMQTAMGVTPTQATALDLKLEELAHHPRVQGLVVDLSGVTSLGDLYSAWDADPGNPDKANAVLFGCHAPLPPYCTAERDGIHDRIRSLLQAYTGAKYLVLVGDDRIIPFARLTDRAFLFQESNYTSDQPGAALRASVTTVGRALEANKYLSDDPLGVLDSVKADSLGTSLFVPDLGVGRLVERPEEITATIATFISQDGVLDLSTLDATTGHKVLITGYDFLSDSARKIRSRWKSAFGVSTPDGSVQPVDGGLIGGNWGLGSVAERRTALRTHLSGNGGARYGLMSLNGHATHFEEGVPGASRFDIQGLSSADIYGTDTCATPSAGALNLAGAVVYAVGCHGGLSVPGSCASDADHSLDLPQTLLSRGVVAYVANTGYGWGLKHGIGYGERLVEILSEEMTQGSTVVAGEAVRETKRRYVLESPHLDSYDQKSLMQWTFFGLPMYAIKTGIAAVSGLTVGDSSLEGASVADGNGEAVSSERPSLESFGPVRVERRLHDDPARASASPFTPAAAVLPGYLTRLDLHFDFTAPGVYRKWSAAGDPLSDTPGCPALDGCYYTLNSLVERSSGMADRPVQPYFIYDSRLSGTSQHGVLWRGGLYDEESGWRPVLAELESNGGDGSNHGSTPRTDMIEDAGPRLVVGRDPEQCRPSDLELNSIVVGAGEAVKNQAADLSYSIQRRYREIDLEVFYFNDSVTPQNNCDREGPALGAAPFHSVSGNSVSWSIPATDASGVWRVLVVSNDGTLDAQGRGRWLPLELTFDSGSQRFVGSQTFTGIARITYVVQAVDKRGNVTWLEFTTAAAPGTTAAATGAALEPAAAPPAECVGGQSATSGVQPKIPCPIDVTLGATPNPGLSVSDATVTEGHSGTSEAVFAVFLSAPSAQTVTVNYVTADDTAVAGSDYTAASGSLSFAPGITTQTLSVLVNGDTAAELSETFFLRLSSPVNATLTDAEGIGRIVDDDSPASLPRLSIEGRNVTEGDSAASFRVLLSHPSEQQVTVSYATQDGAAKAGLDYLLTSGVLTFTPGRTHHSVLVPILPDAEIEGIESYFVLLSSPQNAELAAAQALGTIQDPPGPQDVPMYRAYNPNAFYHFFTTSQGEFTNAVAAGYRDESNPPCCAIPFKVPNLQGTGKAPIHRMYNPNNGRHYYTANSGERDILMGVGWLYEKDEGFVYTSPPPGTVEVFKLYNNISGVHLYTVKPEEKDAILATFPGIWLQHTSLGFAVP